MSRDDAFERQGTGAEKATGAKSVAAEENNEVAAHLVWNVARI